MAEMRPVYVPSRLVCGPHGHAVERGYTEIAGVRFYDDQLVVGPHGQYVISPGKVVPSHPGDANG